MQIIKGFGTITQYVNNTPGQTAILGELSQWSRTYSKEKGEYLDPSVAGYGFTSFRAVEESTNVAVVISQDQVKQILGIIRECYSYASTHIRPYDAQDFKNTILNVYFQKIQNLEFGDFVDNGTLALPDWISWENIDQATPAEMNNKVKVWLADQSFRIQYDEYAIDVVTPLNNLDHFFNAFGNVVQELQQTSTSQFMDKIQAAKLETNPETVVRLQTYAFHNHLNQSQTYPTNWGVLIYGQAGDNIDAIKDAIVEYVLSHSSHSQAEWEVILPDLFKRTQFTIFPRWDKLAVPNQTWQSSLYKSMMDPVECVAFAKNAIDYYTDQFIEQNTLVWPYDYKTLMMVSVNGDTNVTEAARLDQVFPDYLPVPSTSQDFNRMTIHTREWVLFVQQLLLVAETATPYSAIPQNMRKQNRGGVLFISGMYDNINFLVAARSNTSIYPTPTP